MKTKTRTRSDWSALSVHTLVENRRRKIASSCCCVHSAGLCVTLNESERGGWRPGIVTDVLRPKFCIIHHSQKRIFTDDKSSSTMTYRR
jgi:hypothetical protein